MGLERVSTGVSALDNMLGGGYEKDVISTVFGPAGSGKTNMCLLAAISTISSGKKVIYVDTEGGFSVSRLMQISDNYKSILDSILLLKPVDFEEQKKVFERLRQLVNDKIGLIVIDTISMLYRIERDKGSDNSVVMTNRDLGLQFSYLTEISRKKNIPVLITTQVYSSFDDRDKVNLVGGDIVKYGSKCLIELQKGHKNKRIAILKKHRSLPEDKSILLEIREQGLFGLDEQNKLNGQKPGI